MEHSKITSLVFVVLGRPCEQSEWGSEGAPGAFQYFSHMNSCKERPKKILKCQFSLITRRFYAKNYKQ